MKLGKVPLEYDLILFIVCMILYLFWPHLRIIVNLFDEGIWVFISIVVLANFVLLHRIFFRVRLKIANSIMLSDEISIQHCNQIARLSETKKDLFLRIKREYVSYSRFFLGFSAVIFLIGAILVGNTIIGDDRLDDANSHVLGKALLLSVLTLFIGLDLLLTSYQLRSQEEAKEYVVLIFSSIPAFLYHWIVMIFYGLVSYSGIGP